MNEGFHIYYNKIRNSGSWKNYHVTDEHMCISTLFLKQLYENGIFSLKFLLDAWILDKREFAVYFDHYTNKGICVF
jgi:hypothetical protein